MTRARASLLIVLLTGVLVWTSTGIASAAAPADPVSEAAFLNHTNAERTSRGLGALSSAADLVAVARQHAQDMAAQHRLYDDPGVGSEISGWSAWGENSGTGPSVDAVEAAFMASPPHRANILGNYTQVGIGVVWTGAQLWVAEVFRLPSSSTPAPAPAPAASPAPPTPVRVAAPAPVHVPATPQTPAPTAHAAAAAPLAPAPTTTPTTPPVARPVAPLVLRPAAASGDIGAAGTATLTPVTAGTQSGRSHPPLIALVAVAFVLADGVLAARLARTRLAVA